MLFLLTYVELRGAFYSTKNSGNSGLGNSHFPEFHSEILGAPREVGLKFRKIGITENSVPFDHSCSGLVSPSLEIEFNMADPHASKHNTGLKYLTATLLQ